MLRIAIVHPGQDPREFTHPEGPLEFGRGEGAPPHPRCRIPDKYVSKDHLRVCEIAGGQVVIENLSQTNAARIGMTSLGVSERQEFALPVKIVLGETTIELSVFVEEQEDDTVGAASIAGAILKTIKRSVVMNSLTKSEPFLSLRGDMTPERLLTWFEAVVAVQRAAAGSAEFFQQTAQALVELVGLDCGVVLLRRDEEWTRVSEAGERSHADQELSRSILRSVLLRKQTSYRTFDANSLTGTHHSVDEVVAAPIFDAGDQVVGALYGTRDVTNAPGKGLGAIEAQVVQLLAAVAGTGLARQTQEADAARARVQFEQFFSPQLAAHLARDPQLLEAQEREITVLFTDMRGFSSLTEQLGPQAIYALMRDVMERIVAAVRAQEGVVVDYTGDGLLAMWNAPADQPDHAVRACRAALEMVAELPDVNQAWRERLAGGEIGLGVGINTGRALVGNTGTRHKFKYGPHGHTVNLGSRVEMATRQLGIPILISHTTHAALGGCFATRRLCRAHVAGIDAPVDLFELHGEEAATLWIARKANYEAALELFETRRFSEACRQIYPLLADPSGQEDIPSLTLIARAVECLKNPPHDFDPAIRIGKV